MMIPWEYVSRPINYVSFPSEPSVESTVQLLPDKHRDVLSRVVTNVLSTDLAERAYAEILDGLPSVESVEENRGYSKAYSPALELHKDGICADFIEKARRLRLDFDSLTLSFKSTVLEAFANAPIGSSQFHLRLIELVVVSCHQIGARCFKFDDGEHKHQFYNDWRNDFLQQKATDETMSTVKDPHPTAFAHSFYCDYEQYPRGLANCKSMWLHDQRGHTPNTPYPPTSEQFTSLVDFLLSQPGPEKPQCPLPIAPTNENRPRWHPWHAFARYHIFRDRYERKVSADEPQYIKQNVKDWPELQEQSIIMMKDCGMLPAGLEELAAKARERSLDHATWMTPSSPAWTTYDRPST